MENVFALVYCNGDVIPSYEGIVFECPGDPKFITISEDMSLTALRKRIFESNGGCIILIHPFYHQPIYVGDGCVEYDCMELKGDDDVGKIFFIYSEISTKDLIELNATFGRSPNEILVLVHKPKKPRTLDEISDLMRDESELGNLKTIFQNDDLDVNYETHTFSVGRGLERLEIVNDQ
ncbi:hypothetical protein JHK87_000995 [Glycine soja]|nr:hypothetical protein JHK87_000995 [Glycine soja]